MKPFNIKFQESAGLLTGADRFSETIGEKPTHTLLVATLPSCQQTNGFADESDRKAFGHLLAAAPDMLTLLREIQAQVHPDRINRNGLCLDTKINGTTLDHISAVLDILDMK